VPEDGVQDVACGENAAGADGVQLRERTGGLVGPEVCVNDRRALALDAGFRVSGTVARRVGGRASNCLDAIKDAQGVLR